jgi:hypothetical protein
VLAQRKQEGEEERIEGNGSDRSRNASGIEEESLVLAAEKGSP